MRTVDILIAARDLLSDKSNWTQGTLYKYSVAKKKNCFCALGATVKAGGGLTEASSGLNLRVRPEIFTSGSNGIGGLTPVATEMLGITSPTDDGYVDVANVPSLPRAALKALEATGLYVTQTANAVRYLHAATKQVTNGEHHAVFVTNDDRNKARAYDTIMKVFDRAIRNAKRRHVTGDRKKNGVAKETHKVGYYTDTEIGYYTDAAVSL